MEDPPVAEPVREPLAASTVAAPTPAPPPDVEEAQVIEEPRGHRAEPLRPEPPRFVFGNPFAYTLARFAAFVADIALVTVVAACFIYGFAAINPLTNLPAPNEGLFDQALAIGAAAGFVYVWLAEAIFGTTLFKLAFGLHVYAVRGGFVGFGRSFVRTLLRPVDLLAIGGILSLLPGHRRLGDLLGGTVVARSPLRAFAPLVGWVAIIAIGALPFVVVGTEHVLATLVAFAAFVPALAAKGVAYALTLAGAAAPTPAPSVVPSPLVTGGTSTT